MLFNFCPKSDASFWENGSKLKRFVLELQTGGFADYKWSFKKRKGAFFQKITSFFKNTLIFFTLCRDLVSRWKG